MADLDFFRNLLTEKGIPFEQEERNGKIELVVKNEKTGLDLDQLEMSLSSYDARLVFTTGGTFVGIYAGC